MQYARIFVTPGFMELPTWYELFVDFYNFKVCGEHPAYWGRDATLYQEPLGKVQLSDSLWSSSVGKRFPTLSIGQ